MPLIAETGGINAMIVDATALPEQVTDDVVDLGFPFRRSALFGAAAAVPAGRCRADRILDMLVGAARALEVGDPRRIATHVGPVIDADAKQKLDRWIAEQERAGRLHFRWDSDRALPPLESLSAPPSSSLIAPAT